MPRPILDMLRKGVEAKQVGQPRPLLTGLRNRTSGTPLTPDLFKPVRDFVTKVNETKEIKRKNTLNQLNSIRSMFQGNSGIARKVAGGLRSRIAERINQSRNVNN